MINYIYNYPKEYLYFYIETVIEEMQKRNITIKSWTNFNKYFQLLDNDIGFIGKPHFAEHNDEYLTICYWNLREKYIRGQKDFTKDVWEKLEKFYQEKVKGEK